MEIVGCEEATRIAGAEWSGCCNSCHDDAEYGYDELSEVEIRAGDDVVTAVICCRVLNAIPEAERETVYR